MKKLIFLLLLIACTKEKDPECYTCEIKAVGTMGITVIPRYTSTVIAHPCELSALQSIEYENSHSGTTIELFDAGFGNIQKITVVKTTKCRKD